MSTTFKDAKDREWKLSLSGLKLTKLREMLGYSPAIVSNAEGVAKWRGLECTRDPDLFLDVLIVILGDQLEKKQVTRDDFLDAFTDETYPLAEAAYRHCFYSFSPIRDALTRAFEGGGETEEEPGPSPSKNGHSRPPGQPESTPALTASES